MEVTVEGVPSIKNAMTVIAEYQNQVPYATSRALNTLAFEIRTDTIGTLAPSRFHLRNKTLLTNRDTGFHVESADKRNLQSRAFSKWEPWKLQEEGGTRYPKGKNLAIPQRENLGVDIQKIIPKGMRPKALLDKPRAFIATMPSGKNGIWQRLGKARLPIRLLYAFGKQALIKKIFGFHENGAAMIQRKYKRIFGEELAKAIATAKAKGYRL